MKDLMLGNSVGFDGLLAHVEWTIREGYVIFSIAREGAQYRIRYGSIPEDKMEACLLHRSGSGLGNVGRGND